MHSIRKINSQFDSVSEAITSKKSALPYTSTAHTSLNKYSHWGIECSVWVAFECKYMQSLRASLFHPSEITTTIIRKTLHNTIWNPFFRIDIERCKCSFAILSWARHTSLTEYFFGILSEISWNVQGNGLGVTPFLACICWGIKRAFFSVSSEKKSRLCMCGTIWWTVWYYKTWYGNIWWLNEEKRFKSEIEIS